MTFYATIGYQFPVGDGVVPDGSMVLASALPMHQLERRHLGRYPHLKRRLFDPQLYLARLDSVQCKKHCAKLASYPWFGVEGLAEYASGRHKKLGRWMQMAQGKIASVWPGQPPQDESTIRQSAGACVDFQIRFGCEAAILPSPLTDDPSTNYETEEMWLDAGLDHMSGLGESSLPRFATVAISDLCLRMKPKENPLLANIVDCVSAREGLDGVYLVVEQASEAPESRYCSTERTLASVLHLVHVFANDAGLRVGVNFLGPYGLVCAAVGAEWWASNWYLSLRRVRLADKLLGGRAFPIYWSCPCVIDIHLDAEFDKLVQAGHLPTIRDETAASASLLTAAEKKVRVAQVPAWAYRQSNVVATREHYLLSCIREEERHAKDSGAARLDRTQKWLEEATSRVSKVEKVLGLERKTRTQHVPAWRNSFKDYRDLHKV